MGIKGANKFTEYPNLGVEWAILKVYPQSKESYSLEKQTVRSGSLEESK